MPSEPCRTPLMKPRERAGQLSIAKAAPTGHSAPKKKPNNARKKKRNVKLGAKPEMKLQNENPRIEIISGTLRPTRSANQPAAVAPTSRIHNKTVSMNAVAVRGTPK